MKKAGCVTAFAVITDDATDGFGTAHEKAPHVGV